MKSKALSTEDRMVQYQGKIALLQTYDALPIEERLKNKNYISRLRKEIGLIRNYLKNRSDSNIEIYDRTRTET